MTTINICPECKDRKVQQIDAPKSLRHGKGGTVTAGRKMKSEAWRQTFAWPLDYWFKCLKCGAIWRA